MKTLSLIIIILVIGCAAAPPPIHVCQVCPPEDVIINTPSGPLGIDKGLMTPENYYTIPEWQKLYEDYRKAQGL